MTDVLLDVFGYAFLESRKGEQLMNETPFFVALLHEHYPVDIVTLEHLSGSSFGEGYFMYRIHHPTGSSWVARLYRRDR